MKKSFVVRSSVITITGVISLLCLRVEAEGLPARQSGLWELTITASSRAPTVIKQCVDSKTDEKMMKSVTEGATAMGGACTTSGVVRTASGYESSSTCQMMNSKISSEATFEGDFKNSYSGEVVSKISPPLMGQSGGTTKIAGKWLGACPDDMKPGEVLTPGGGKLNIDQLTQQAKEMQKLVGSRGAGATAEVLKQMMKLQQQN